MARAPKPIRRREYWQSRMEAASSERDRMVAGVDYLRATLATAPAALAERIYGDIADHIVQAADEALEVMT